MRISIPLSLFSLLGALIISRPAFAQVVKITPETSTNAAGPYGAIAPSALQPSPDGAWFFSKSQSEQFFRLRIDDVPRGPAAPISTSAVPATVFSRAHSLLSLFSRTDDDTNRIPGDAVWENAALAPLVCPIFDPGVSNGASAALLEFKVIPARAASRLRRGVLADRPEDVPTDLGYILVSLTDDNFPVVSFSNEGLTPVEKLWRRAGTRSIKPVQFDNTLLIAEDDAGNMLANLGSVPFKIPPSALAQINLPHQYDGDDDLEIDNRPRPVRLGATHYASYLEFKTDFQTNRVYQILRAQRAAAAREQWDIERGIYPEVILIDVNELRFILAGEDITSFRFFSEDGADLRIDEPSTTSGLRLFGLKPGDGRLIVELPGRTITYAVGVRIPRGLAPAGGFTPGPQPPKFWYAGSWNDQPKYHQLEDNDWCPLVGCGPTAWAILFAWFERERGVRGAFGNWTAADAPINAKSGNRQFVFPVMDDLHELCDVICTAFSDQGATEPSDMSEGGLGYTFTPRILGYIRRSWRMKWTIWDDCPEDGALECAEAIKKGYPAVVGLGWLWHYAVAYGYQRVDWKFAPDQPAFLIYRYLKCNMGWGDTVQWYNLCDTFFSSDFRIRNGPNAVTN